MFIFHYASKFTVRHQTLLQTIRHLILTRPSHFKHDHHSLCIVYPKITKFPAFEQTRRKHGNPKSRQLPDLIYIPHVLRWLKTKLRFKYLQSTWDQEFSEGAFIYGSTHAICRITEIIHENKANELHNLVTISARQKLLFDMTRRLSKTQKKIIKLNPDDIKILVPLSVTFDQNDYRKQCRIKMRVLALKWYEQVTGAPRLVLVALQTEFLRDYSPEARAEWTISDFDILECTMLSEAPPNM